jgi:hypothetical protein
MREEARHANFNEPRSVWWWKDREGRDNLFVSFLDLTRKSAYDEASNGNDSNDDTAQDSAQLKITHSNRNKVLEASKKTAMPCVVK